MHTMVIMITGMLYFVEITARVFNIRNQPHIYNCSSKQSERAAPYCALHKHTRMNTHISEFLQRLITPLHSEHINTQYSKRGSIIIHLPSAPEQSQFQRQPHKMSELLVHHLQPLNNYITRQVQNSN